MTKIADDENCPCILQYYYIAEYWHIAGEGIDISNGKITITKNNKSSDS